MNGGTYSEALKAGFTEEQSGFLGRLSSETKSEVVEYLDEREEKRLKILKATRNYKILEAAHVLFLLCIGAGLGIIAILLIGK